MAENRLLNRWRKLTDALRLSRRPQQSPMHAALIAAAAQVAHDASPLVPGDQALSDESIVVYDLETSGLNTATDSVLSIGAATISKNAIPLGNVFEEILGATADLNSESQLIHGLTLKDLADGSPPRAALLRFLQYSTNRIWVAYHAEFDRVMLQKAIDHWLGVTFDPRPFDVAELAPMLFPDKGPAYGPLDHWLQVFGLTPRERHNALGDAMITAELMLIMLDRACQLGYRTWGELNEACHAWRQVQRHLPNL